VATPDRPITVEQQKILEGGDFELAGLAPLRLCLTHYLLRPSKCFGLSVIVTDQTNLGFQKFLQGIPNTMIRDTSNEENPGLDADAASEEPLGATIEYALVHSTARSAIYTLGSYSGAGPAPSANEKQNTNQQPQQEAGARGYVAIRYELSLWTDSCASESRVLRPRTRKTNGSTTAMVDKGDG
jgi:hypothetical protein